MKKTITLLLFFFTLLFVKDKSGILSAQWVAQSAPTGTTSLYSVYAISPTSVACAGAQEVIRSLDGGITWVAPITLGGVNLYTVHSGVSTSWLSLSLNTPWSMRVGNPGGVTLNYGLIDSIMALHFNTPSCATAVGTNGKIETTCDSSATWQVRVFSGLTLNSVWYANTNTGVACGVFGAIKRTVNGGANWVNVTCPVTQNLNGITFADTLTGYIVGNSGTFLKTIDGGASWTSMPLSITNNLNGVYFVSTDTGYVVGSSGLIKKTVDGGTTWTTMNSGTTQTLHSVHFTNSVTGWVCGDGAALLKYCPTLAITGSINGNTTVCAGDTLTYSANTVSGASGYVWSFPAGWAGNSITNTINLISGNTGGTISVAATNACGNGTPTTLAVTVNPPPVPVITQSNNVLTSSSATNNQWYLNGVAIAGATGQTYTFTSNGSYSVVVTSGSCSSNSLPHIITNTGVNEFADNADLFIYPNPTSGLFEITISNPSLIAKTGNVEIKITDVLGNNILQSVVNNQSTIDLSNAAQGIYFVQITNDNKVLGNRKIIKQ